MQQLRLFFAMALLYMFRVIIPPIIRIRLIQLSLGVLVLVSQFCLLGVYELNICGSVHHA